MANNDRHNMSTCPICGYTDTAGDADALQMAIEEHIRMAHNLDPATLGGTAGSVKTISNDMAAEIGGSNDNGNTIPIIAAAPNSSVGGTSEAGTGNSSGAGLLGAKALIDTDDNARTLRDNETGRF